MKKLALIMIIIMSFACLTGCNKDGKTQISSNIQPSSSKVAVSSKEQILSDDVSSEQVSSQEETSSQEVLSQEQTSSEEASSLEEKRYTIEQTQLDENIVDIFYICPTLASYKVKDSENFGFINSNIQNKSDVKYIEYNYCTEHGLFATCKEGEENYSEEVIDISTGMKNGYHFGHAGGLVGWDSDMECLIELGEGGSNVLGVNSEYTAKDNLNQVVNTKQFLEPNDSNCKFGYYNKNLELQIPLEYEGATAFSNGVAGVKLDGKWGYIDEQENVLIAFEYDSTYNSVEFYNFEQVYPMNNGFLVLCKEQKYGIINGCDINDVVLDFSFDKIVPTSNGEFFALKEGKWSLVKIS